MAHDLRFALRSLAKSPAFALTVVVTLALAVGATTAVYSAVHGILLSPLPFPAADELVTVWEDRSARGGPESEWTGRSNFRDWQRRSHAFSSLTALLGFAADLGDAGRPERLNGAAVSHEYFSTLGVQPALGRDFRAAEETPGNEYVAILSHELWQRRFAGDPEIVGSTVRLSDQAYEVIGVLPPGFDAPMQPAAEVFVPLDFPADLVDRGNAYVRVIGRRATGVSQAAAGDDMDRVGRGIAAEHPIHYEQVGVVLEPLRDTLVANARTPLQVLFGAVVLVLMIACANVANLVLVRATVREEELAVRTALGAPRGRLVRALLAEGMLLAAAGGAAGLFLATWGVDLLRTMAPAGTPRVEGIALDGGVVLFAAAVTLATGLAFGLVPAWSASRPRLRQVLGGDGRGGAASARGSGLRRGLVVAEIAVGLALLAGAALLLRSLDELGRVDVGLDTAGVAVGSVLLPSESYPEEAQVHDFYDRLLAALDADPAVESAGAVSVLPLSGGQLDVSFVLDGETVEAGREPGTDMRTVSPDYFATLGIPVLAGRPFDRRDAATTPKTVVVSQRFVDRFIPAGDPLGRRLKLGAVDNDQPWRTIVGVVGGVRDNQVAKEPDPELYLPLTQGRMRFATLVARGRGDGETAAERATAALHRALAAVDPDRPLAGAGSMDELVATSLAPSRFVTGLLATFAGVALLLALVGIYGVMACAVGQRRREIGVRIALGADRGRVIGLVLAGGGRLVALGVVLGLGLSLALGRGLVGLLYGVEPWDPWTLAVVALLLAGAALGACWLPARRASRFDPVAVLRG